MYHVSSFHFLTVIVIQWHRIYTSDSDGLSFNRLLNSLLGYDGPTLIIIKETERKGIFGAYANARWRESKDFYGDSDCFLFRLQPTAAVYRPRGTGANYMYCNSESRSKGTYIHLTQAFHEMVM